MLTLGLDLLLAGGREVVDHAATPQQQGSAETEDVHRPVIRPADEDVGRHADVDRRRAEQPVHHEVVVSLGRRVPCLAVLLLRVEEAPAERKEHTTHHQRTEDEQPRLRHGVGNLPIVLQTSRNQDRQTEVTGHECSGLALPEGHVTAEHVPRLEDIRHKKHGVGDEAD